jgi:thioredoxin reductase
MEKVPGLQVAGSHAAVSSHADSQYELVIVGGGPAGLSAALIAARARRRVLLVNGGVPRNSVSTSINGYLGSDGTEPDAFQTICLRQILAYPTVSFLDGVVDSIAGNKGSFQVRVNEIESSRKSTFNAARVLLAVGMVDILPEIPGLNAYWGKGVHHCPYCDGYKQYKGKWGLLANGDITDALFLLAWTSNLVYLTDGEDLSPGDRQKLLQHGIDIETQKLAEVVGDKTALTALRLENGCHLSLDSLWIAPRHRQHALINSLAHESGLALDGLEEISCDEHGETSIKGIYAAGDVAADGIKQAILAAADGARVALSINKDLIHERYY